MLPGRVYNASEYPEQDFPWTLYFNGEQMPRWSNCFNWFPFQGPAEQLLPDKDSFYDYATGLFRMRSRIDHGPAIESEDPDIFRVCCLTMTFILLRDEAEMLESLSSIVPEGVSPTEVLVGVRNGLFAMHHRCLTDRIAFWASGYERDQRDLKEYIRRHRLPKSDVDWIEAPHIQRLASDASSQSRSLREDLLELLDSHRLHKDVRRLVHELPRFL